MLPSKEAAILALELSVLDHMARSEMFGTSAAGDGQTCFPLRAFGLHPELCRGLLRSMRDKGLVYFGKGLWTDDGDPAGAGYGITKAGLDRLRTFEEGCS